MRNHDGGYLFFTVAAVAAAELDAAERESL